MGTRAGIGVAMCAEFSLAKTSAHTIAYSTVVFHVDSLVSRRISHTARRLLMSTHLQTGEEKRGKLDAAMKGITHCDDSYLCVL